MEVLPFELWDDFPPASIALQEAAQNLSHSEKCDHGMTCLLDA